MCIRDSYRLALRALAMAPLCQILNTPLVTDYRQIPQEYSQVGLDKLDFVSPRAAISQVHPTGGIRVEPDSGKA